MTLTPLYNSESGGVMRVAGLMSGSGSNLIKIIQHERKRYEDTGERPYRVSVIFSDNSQSNAQEIGREYKIPVIVRDLAAFCQERGRPKKDMVLRGEFDKLTAEQLRRWGVKTVAYAGYMAIATESLTDAFLGVNVHPADLSIMQNGKRKYTGDNAVRDAILAGEKCLKSTTHIVEPQVDQGRILMVSPQLDVVLPEGFNPNDEEQVKRISNEHQSRLKEVGDWFIFPRTLEYIALGRYTQDESNLIHFNGKPMPNGFGAYGFTITTGL